MCFFSFAGRLRELLESKVLRTEDIRLFVLDEADKLAEKDFAPQIKFVAPVHGCGRQHTLCLAV